VSDIRDPQQVAKVALDQLVKKISPNTYRGVQSLDSAARDAVSLLKARRDGTLDSESQRILNENALKLATVVVKENKIKGLDVDKLRDTAQLAAKTDTYLQDVIRKYDANNQKAVAYNDLAAASDQMRLALERKEKAKTPEEKKAADASVERSKMQLVEKKQLAEVVDAQEKDIKPDPKPVLEMTRQLTEDALKPVLKTYGGAAFAVAKEAAADLPTMAVKIQATNAVTAADTRLAATIQTALDAKKIRDGAKTAPDRAIAEQKFETAIKEVARAQQEAEARRAANYMIRSLPDDSVVGVLADAVAPGKMIEFDRNQR
jgi:hypothetical protein